MRAAWYDHHGPSREVLHVGEQQTPAPAPGEVLVRVEPSGIHVGDIGKRQGYWGSTMAFPLVIPHGERPPTLGRRTWRSRPTGGGMTRLA